MRAVETLEIITTIVRGYIIITLRAKSLLLAHWLPGEIRESLRGINVGRSYRVGRKVCRSAVFPARNARVSVPYDQVDQDSALVEMFGQVGAYKCKYIVAFGALAGLTVSMFGSMFPMPRIVYAMAQDGLIFR